MIQTKLARNFQTSFTVVITIAVWLAFAPSQVGGIASYIIVIGDSMEPGFHKGDLVIAHQQPVYRVGDVIVYKNREVANFVFHRIISHQMGRYTLKGDNNTWVDNYQPSYEEVLGKLWFHIPGGGSVIQKMRSPIAMALLAGVFGAVLAASLFTNHAKDDKPMRNKSLREQLISIKQRIRSTSKPGADSEPQKRLGLFKPGEFLEGSFFMLGLIALSSSILGMIALFRPVSRVVQDDISYQHLGVFAYSASTPQGVYDANTIKSGDPIFTNLTCSVDMNFTYSLVAGQVEGLRGTYQLTAVLRGEANGWQRILPLQEAATFSGTAFGTSARLDLCKIQSLVQSMENETSVHAGSYAVVITPNIKLDGNISGRVLTGSFNPTLTFRYDRLQFYLARNDTQSNPLTIAESGILHKEREEANTILLLGREMTIPALRIVAFLGLITSTGTLIFLGLRLQYLSRSDQEKFFRIKYDSLMIDVQDVDMPADSQIIDVQSIDTLAKVAERFNAVILHTVQRTLHTYLVQSGGNTYRYVISFDRTGSTVPEPVRGIAD